MKIMLLLMCCFTRDWSLAWEQILHGRKNNLASREGGGGGRGRGRDARGMEERGEGGRGEGEEWIEWGWRRGGSRGFRTRTRKLRDSSVRSICTYLTASPCYTSNTNTTIPQTNIISTIQQLINAVSQEKREGEGVGVEEGVKWGWRRGGGDVEQSKIYHCCDTCTMDKNIRMVQCTCLTWQTAELGQEVRQ